MPPSRKDITSPANAITVTGLCLTIAGSLQLTTPLGLVLVLLGKILDIADGFVARRTHTSRFGAIMDATADKLTSAAILAAAWHYSVAPRVVILLVLLQQAIVTVISLIAERRKLNLEVTFAGKINMFVQISALLSFIASEVIDPLDSILLFTAWLLAAIGVVTGIIATFSYIRSLRKRLNKN